MPSVNLPVAVNCILVPSPNLASGVDKVIDASLALETVKLVAVVVVPNCAPIVLVPAAAVVVFPALGFAATPVLLEDHLVFETEVRSCTLPPKSPVA